MQRITVQCQLSYVVDGAQLGQHQTYSGTEYDLSKGLSIHRFEETVGVIMVLFNKKAVPEFNLEGRVGIGAKQNAFNGQKIISKFEDDVATVDTKEYTSKVGVK